MKNIFIIAVFVTGIIFTLKGQNIETRTLSEFSKISVGEAISVILIPGNKNEARIKAERIDPEDVETDIIGSKLRIGLAGTRHRNVRVLITLIYKSINSIAVNSASEVATKGVIKATKLDISVSSAGDAELEIKAEDIDVDVSSSGTLTLSGTAISQRVEVSSAGEYDAYDLKCEDVYVRASSAGSARVNASRKIEAKASSAGSVKYSGKPDKVFVNSSSGGEVRKTY